MSDQQKGGAALSFAMRYALIMALALTSAGIIDTDGAAGIERISDEQAKDILALLEETKSSASAFCKWLKVDHVEDIPEQAYKDAVAALERKRK